MPAPPSQTQTQGQPTPGGGGPERLGTGLAKTGKLPCQGLVSAWVGQGNPGSGPKVSETYLPPPPDGCASWAGTQARSRKWVGGTSV